MNLSRHALAGTRPGTMRPEEHYEHRRVCENAEGLAAGERREPAAVPQLDPVANGEEQAKRVREMFGIPESATEFRVTWTIGNAPVVTHNAPWRNLDLNTSERNCYEK